MWASKDWVVTALAATSHHAGAVVLPHTLYSPILTPLRRAFTFRDAAKIALQVT